MQNLWEEFDNKHSPASSETVGQGHHGRNRRLTERDILFSLRNWLLLDYVAPYCRSLAATRIYRRCYWIDALGIDTRANSKSEYTGEVSPDMLARPESENGSKKGRKKDTSQGGQLLPPILQPIASLSQSLAQESKSINLHGLILEAGSSKRKETRTAKNENITLPKESGIVRASWLEAAPIILQFIDQSPAIFLLNPLGQTIFTYDDLAPLYQRTVPTELLLLISHKQLETRLLAALDSPHDASTLTVLLRSDRWKTLLAKGEAQEEAKTANAIDRSIDLLIASMQRHFLSVQRDAFSIQTRSAVVKATPYTLLFATRRPDSLVSMNDALCIYRRRLDQQSHQGVLGEEWFARQYQEHLAEEMTQLYQRILHLGKTQRVRRWSDLRQQLVVANFGQFTSQDYDEVMRELLISGDVRCEWRRKIVAEGNDEALPQSMRLPGNEDTLVWR